MATCFNRRTLIGLGIAAVALISGAAITGRGIAGLLPLLLVLACPLSMMAMMVSMRGMGRSDDKEACRRPSTADADTEIARLRAEVAELRSQRAGSLPPPTGARTVADTTT